MQKEKNKIVSGLAWTFLERVLAQLVSTIIGIILARLLMPEDYGIIAIVLVVATLLEVFATSGFGVALVQKKHADDEDFNTAFVISFILSVSLYVVLYFIAPVIASFYKIQALTLIIRVLGIKIVFTSLNTIQQAKIQRSMEFKRFFFATISGTTVGCAVGLVMAFKGFGVWSLVFQNLSTCLINTIVLSFTCGWKPRFRFTKSKAKEIYSLGWKVLCTQLVFTVEGDIRSLAVGKVFGPSDLACYDQGKKYPSLIMDNINASLQKVMLPAYSKEQDRLDVLKGALRKTINIGMFVLAPILLGFAAVSENFVVLVLTEKWLPVVPFLMIFCVNYLTRPIESSCHQALLALNKNALVLKLMILINGSCLLFTLFSVFVIKSVLWIAILTLLSTLISLISFLIATNKYVGYKLKEQISDLMGPIALSVIMAVLVYLFGLLNINIVLELCLQVVVGVVVYIALSCIFKPKAFTYIINIVKDRLPKKNKKKKTLLITMDTEGDNLWKYKMGEKITTNNVKYLSRFQDLCNKYNFKPVWLSNYEMIADDDYVTFIKNVVENHQGELGMHLHAWNSPPDHELIVEENGAPYLIEYPKEIMEKKVAFLTNYIVERTGIRPLSHRAGRWAMNDDYYEILYNNGYIIDCSVTPGINWSSCMGATKGFAGSDYSNEPSTINNKKGMVEIPVTIIKTHKFFPKLGIKANIREFKQALKGHHVWLRPNGHNLNQMKWMAKKVYKSNSEYIMFMLHSSELMPNGSPTFSTDKEIEKLYKDLDRLFKYLDKKYIGQTLIDYYEGVNKNNVEHKIDD